MNSDFMPFSSKTNEYLVDCAVRKEQNGFFARLGYVSYLGEPTGAQAVGERLEQIGYEQVLNSSFGAVYRRYPVDVVISRSLSDAAPWRVEVRVKQGTMDELLGALPEAVLAFDQFSPVKVRPEQLFQSVI